MNQHVSNDTDADPEISIRAFDVRVIVLKIVFKSVVVPAVSERSVDSCAFRHSIVIVDKRIVLDDETVRRIVVVVDGKREKAVSDTFDEETETVKPDDVRFVNADEFVSHPAPTIPTDPLSNVELSLNPLPVFASACDSPWHGFSFVHSVFDDGAEMSTNKVDAAGELQYPIVGKSESEVQPTIDSVVIE
ncbi:hypothetical protein BLNAU_4168 [Blattamonas nauphoetae]|uniref:Uncharacterized protein n=1 Tax=Blattamonas nauphoetae TaxID=2049346 RepID=A0ABQ9YAS4_9EUKA|nr:hypothetical protein BLNAU_4168 [Blattamonas nauphoetae]